MTDDVIREPATLGAAGSRRQGVLLALGTAVISGVAVFLNAYGVKRFATPSVYTTAKNLVAALALVGLGGLLASRRAPEAPARPRRPVEWLGLAIVGVIGGSVPFLLFFEGLSRSTSTHAAFLQKTLVVWVVLLAVPLLRERVGPLHVTAVVLLLVGQARLDGGLSGFHAGGGEAMILGATLFWAVEVVLAKRLLGSLTSTTVGIARMGVGSVVLVAWLLATGRADDLAVADAGAWGWALLTGLILAAYVATWFAALARAQAVDVTAVLVFGAVITAALATAVQDAALASKLGPLVMIAAGTALVFIAARRHPVRGVVPT